MERFSPPAMPCCTPSAVSQQPSKLERETKTTLVEKDGRRLHLTEVGRVLADHASRVISALDEAEAALAAHRDTMSGRPRVASFATACRALLPSSAIGRRFRCDSRPASSTWNGRGPAIRAAISALRAAWQHHETTVWPATGAPRPP
jgi:hypothetical protein